MKKSILIILSLLLLGGCAKETTSGFIVAKIAYPSAGYHTVRLFDTLRKETIEVKVTKKEYYELIPGNYYESK